MLTIKHVKNANKDKDTKHFFIIFILISYDKLGLKICSPLSMPEILTKIMYFVNKII